MLTFRSPKQFNFSSFHNKNGTPLSEADLRIEMTPTEINFLMQFVREVNPQNVLEIGVASGGVSALILKSTNNQSKLTSVDLNKFYYRNSNLKTGYVVDLVCEDQERKKMNLLVGNDVIGYVDNLQKNLFDFVILDTVHKLPGEYLQFFAIYPFLKKSCCVILHDLSLNIDINQQNYKNRKFSFATMTLFSNIRSERKFLLYQPMSNIGAFFIDETTEKYIEETFLAMRYEWHYLPDNLKQYLDFVKIHYSDFCYKYLLECINSFSKFK